MQTLVNQRELTEKFDVHSAGTIGYHEGRPADERMQAAARKRGYQLDSLSRKIEPTDLERFDLVIAMDQENLRDIQSLHQSPTATIKLLSEYLDDDWPRDVPDPYYGGAQGFEEVLNMIEAACPKILDELLTE